MTAAAYSTARPAVPDIVEEHLEELAFLGIRMRKLLFSPEVNSRQLARQAARVEAHRDGLRIAGEAARKLARTVLDEGEDPWLIYAAASTWLELNSPDAAELSARWKDLPPVKLPSWREALRQHDVRKIARSDELLATGRPGYERHLIVDALGWQGLLTLQHANIAASDPEPLVRWSAARHLGHALTREPGAMQLLATLVRDADSAVRAAAMWSGALIDQSAALRHARSAADPFALRILGLCGSDAFVEVIAAAVADETRQPVAIAALVDHGGFAAVEALAELSPQYPAALEGVAAILDALPEDVPLDRTWAGDRWRHLGGSEGVRLRLGFTRPWSDDHDYEPMEWHWRAAIAGAGGPRISALHREVPDGFFSGTAREESVPGE